MIDLRSMTMTKTGQFESNIRRVIGQVCHESVHTPAFGILGNVQRRHMTFREMIAANAERARNRQEPVPKFNIEQHPTLETQSWVYVRTAEGWTPIEQAEPIEPATSRRRTQ